MRERLLAAENVQAIEWREGALYLLDQRLLPRRQVWLRHDDVAAVAEAIRAGLVRGGQAFAIAAAYGLVLAARMPGAAVQARLEEGFALLQAAQPAVDIAWVLQRMSERLQRLRSDADVVAQLEAEALAIHAIDREANLTMAQLGAELIRKHQKTPQSLLLHGGAGALATGGFGVALGVVRCAHLASLVEQVYVGEARPWLADARLAVWELTRDGVPASLSVDGAAAHLMKVGGITWVLVEAQRIAANGDVLGRVGTYQLAVAAMHHGLRFMVVAPSSLIDMELESGEDISPDALASEAGGGAPVFDVTPADLVDCIVTERGVVERPDQARIERLMCRKRLH